MSRKERISMMMKNQILVLKERGASSRKIANSLNISRKTVRKYLRKCDSQKSEDIQENICLQEEQSFKVKYANVVSQCPQWLQDLDWVSLFQEREKGISVKILWEESRQAGCPVKYWAFWSALKHLSEMISPSKIKNICVRLNHIPGEKCFVDYCDGIFLVDKTTNKKIKTHLFIGVLPFSGIVFAEFVFDQKIPSFIKSFEKMWKYFGGVTPYVVSDNLKSAVTKSHIYDPEVNQLFSEYANHAGFALLPARPRKPKDKASVERHAGIFQESFYQILRKKEFNTIEQLNQSLNKFLKDFVTKDMKDYGVSRLDRFDEEKKCLLPLPSEDFEISHFRTAKVHPDFHVQSNRCFYSVPHEYVGKDVNVKTSCKMIEIFDLKSGDLIAAHRRLHIRGSRSTLDNHFPLHIKNHLEFDFEKAKAVSFNLGENIHEFICHVSLLPHKLKYLRMVQGLLRMYMSKKFTLKSLEFSVHTSLSKNIFKLDFIKEIAIKNMIEAKGFNEDTTPKRVSSSIFSDKKYERSENL